MMRHRFAVMNFDDFKLERDDMNRVAKMSLHSAAGPELRDDGSFQVPVDGDFRLINNAGRVWYFSGNNPSAANTLNNVKVTLPANAVNAYVANPSSRDQALVYALTPAPSPSRWFYVAGAVVLALGLLMLLAGLLWRRRAVQVLPPAFPRALPRAGTVVPAAPAGPSGPPPFVAEPTAAVMVPPPPLVPPAFSKRPNVAAARRGECLRGTRLIPVRLSDKPFERKDMNPPDERKRILALDGGGVKAMLTLAILERMETLLRAHHGNPDLVLADHFGFVAGTSTGGIVAAALSWGMSVAQIRRFYLERAAEMFTKTPFWHKARAFYQAEPLSAALREIFQDEATGQPALLGTSKLRTLLLLCMRNATTGSAWPVSNNPRARYNQEGEHGSNLQIPLWQLVRASAAAPVFFLPEAIKIGKSAFEFADGGTTTYCNPALIAALMATLPCYRVEWPTGTDRLHLISVGTGRVRSRLKNRSFRAYNLGGESPEYARHAHRRHRRPAEHDVPGVGPLPVRRRDRQRGRRAD